MVHKYSETVLATEAIFDTALASHSEAERTNELARLVHCDLGAGVMEREHGHTFLVQIDTTKAIDTAPVKSWIATHMGSSLLNESLRELHPRSSLQGQENPFEGFDLRQHIRKHPERGFKDLDRVPSRFVVRAVPEGVIAEGIYLTWNDEYPIEAVHVCKNYSGPPWDGPGRTPEIWTTYRPEQPTHVETQWRFKNHTTDPQQLSLADANNLPIAELRPQEINVLGLGEPAIAWHPTPLDPYKVTLHSEIKLNPGEGLF